MTDAFAASPLRRPALEARLREVADGEAPRLLRVRRLCCTPRQHGRMPWPYAVAPGSPLVKYVNVCFRMPPPVAHVHEIVMLPSPSGPLSLCGSALHRSAGPGTAAGGPLLTGMPSPACHCHVSDRHGHVRAGVLGAAPRHVGHLRQLGAAAPGRPGGDCPVRGERTGGIRLWGQSVRWPGAGRCHSLARLLSMHIASSAPAP